MAQNVELEIQVIKRFVEARKQERFIQFVKSAKNRGKFISELPHFRFFKTELLIRVESDEKRVILDALRNAGISNDQCYVISEGSTIDTKTLSVRDAVEATVGYNMGTIIVFGEANMIFFEGENIKSRFISRKVN